MNITAKVGNLARLAGEKAMQFYGGKADFKLKADSSPLTLADRASHEFLLEALQPLLPGVPVISEESEEGGERVVGLSRFWLVDPLDGTKEFLKGTGEFTVNIALIENGQAVLGLVHAPVFGLTYFAEHGKGAFRQQSGEAAEPIHARLANTSALAVVASKDHAGPLVQAMLTRMPGVELKSMGSSLKFCLVAEGKADIYLRDVPTMEWDTAAAQCVVEAAGGIICTLDGKPLAYGKPGLKNPSVLTVGDPNLAWRQYVQK